MTTLSPHHKTKLLTDAELAAEVHRTDCTYFRLECAARSSEDPMTPETEQRLADQFNAMYRFATRPHAHESDYQ